MNKFFNSFKKYLWIYLVTTAVIIVLVCYAFNFRTQPSDSERVGIVVGRFQSGIVKEDFSYPEYIREFNFQEVDGNLFYMTVEAKESVNNIDILIITKDQAENLIDKLIVLDSNTLNTYFNGIATFNIDSNAIGLDLDKINNGKSVDDKLYVCFVKSSLHLGELNNSIDIAAISIISDYINK